MNPPAISAYIKCDVPPSKDAIHRNDKLLFPVCARCKHPERPNNYNESSEIWDTLKKGAFAEEAYRYGKEMQAKEEALRAEQRRAQSARPRIERVGTPPKSWGRRAFACQIDQEGHVEPAKLPDTLAVHGDDDIAQVVNPYTERRTSSFDRPAGITSGRPSLTRSQSVDLQDRPRRRPSEEGFEGFYRDPSLDVTRSPQGSEYDMGSEIAVPEKKRPWTASAQYGSALASLQGSAAGGSAASDSRRRSEKTPPRRSSGSVAGSGAGDDNSGTPRPAIAKALQESSDFMATKESSGMRRQNSAPSIASSIPSSAANLRAARSGRTLKREGSQGSLGGRRRGSWQSSTGADETRDALVPRCAMVRSSSVPSIRSQRSPSISELSAPRWS